MMGMFGLTPIMKTARIICSFGALFASLVCAQGKSDLPVFRREAVLAPRLRGLTLQGGSLPVMVVLTEQPHREILSRHSRRAEQAEVEARHRTLADRGGLEASLRAVRAEWDALELSARQAAFAEIAPAISPSQDAVAKMLQQNGATVRRRYLAMNMIAADVPAAALDRIAADPAVAEVFPLVRHVPQLQSSVPALGATTFWNAGYSGAGQSVAVLDTGVKRNHPAFVGLTIADHIFLGAGLTDPCFGDNANSAEDQNGHGSHVAGIVASRGSSECPNCKGVARSLGTLYNVKIGYVTTSGPGCTAGGSANPGDVYDAIDYLARNTPVRIFNYSYGSPTGDDDNASVRVLDQLADIYNLLPVVAAGNGGPAASTVTAPAIGRNLLAVANWTSRGSIASSSGRGPTVGGRKKPDIAAPGTNIASLAYNWDGSGVGDYVTKSGTSLATPHIAGAAALISEAGVNDSMAIRAVLLNTTDSPGWAADSGWGYANLDKARNALFYQTGTVTARPSPTSFRLYRVVAGAPLRATVTWNRHIVNGSTSVFHDLDLIAYNTATNAEVTFDGSADDNVEQVSLPAAGDYVVKVRMYNTTLAGGLLNEKFAIAFSESNVAVSTGPRLGLTCASLGTPSGTTPFVYQCTVTNTGDLTAFSTTGSVTLPASFTGPVALNFGDVPPGASRTVSLGLTATAGAGNYSISASIQSSSFEETFSASGSFPVTVNPPNPGAFTLQSPANAAGAIPVATALSWAASTNAASYDVYFGTTVPPPFAGNTTATSFNPGALVSETTYYWRVEAKNVTGTYTSPTWSFTTQIVLTAPGSPSPSPGAGNIGVSPTISWSASGTGVTYDVYFGTSAQPPLVGSVTSTFYTPPTLAAGRTYFWSVTARKGNASVSSPVWAFNAVPRMLGVNPPLFTATSPSAATGSPQLLNFTMSDPDGFDDINRMYFLVNTSSATTGTICYGYYDRAGNGIFLYNDALTTAQGPLTPGTSGTLQNGQCTVDGAASSLLTAAGTDVAVRLSVSLKGAFAASSRRIYASVADNEGNTTGWVQTATWSTTNLNRPPSVVSTTPTSPTGSPQTFTLVARDLDGFDNISRVYFLVNPDTTIPQNTCHGYYDRAANMFFLYNDALTALTGPLTGGVSGTLQNSQCSLDGATSGYLSGAGTDLSLRLTMSLKGVFAGSAQKLNFWIVDYDGNGTGWVQVATWGTANLNRAPVLTGSSPSVVTAQQQTLTFNLRDPDGAGNLSRVYFLIQTSTAITTNTCHGFYDRAQNGIYLYNDALTVLQGPLVPGGAGTLQNTQCTLTGSGSAWTVATPTDATLALNVTVPGAYSNNVPKIYVWITDAEGNGTGWLQTGAWGSNPASFAPTIVSATPTAPVGSPQTFSLVSRSPAGAANISRIYFLVNSSPNVQTGSCHGFYDRPGNYFVLYNDALTAAIGPLFPGSGALQNGQCILDGSTSGLVSATGTDLTVRFGLSLQGTLGTTQQNVYFWVQDALNNGTGWVKTNTWTPLAGSAQAPTLAAATPATTTGATRTFTLTARDANGYGDLSRVYFVVNTSASVPVNTCHGFYDRPTNALYLYNDALTALIGPLVPGTAGTLQNSQCAIDGAASSAVLSGLDAVLNLSVTRKGTFANTAQKLYVWITDASGLGTGWVQASQWNP